jgi:hypothetical protein
MEILPGATEAKLKESIVTHSLSKNDVNICTALRKRNAIDQRV